MRMRMRIFISWKHKIQMGSDNMNKYLVIFDWRIKLKYFNRLKRFVQVVKHRRNIKRKKLRIKKEKSKYVVIHNLKRKKILTKYWSKWYYLYKLRSEKRGIKKKNKKTKQKMDLFLNNMKKKKRMKKHEKKRNTSHNNNLNESKISIERQLLNKKKISSKDLVLSMENRLKERKEKWEKLQAVYKRNREEKERHLKEEEKKRILEEKKKKEMIKEKKRRQKELQKQKELRIKRLKLIHLNNIRLADEKRRYLLLKYYGFNLLKKYLKYMEEMEVYASGLYLKRKVKSSFGIWKNHYLFRKVQKIQDEKQKIQLFIQRRNSRNVKEVFIMWKIISIQRRNAMKRGRDLCNSRLRVKYFNFWKNSYSESLNERLNFEKRTENIVNTCSRKFNLSYYFDKWKRGMLILFDENQKSKIGKELQKKVDKWLFEFRLKNNFDWDNLI